MPEIYDLIVIGGGPAGLFCAIHVGKEKKKVLILEKMPTLAKKLLISGSGQCNITHDGDIKSFLTRYGDNGKFLQPALMNCKNTDLISYFSSHGVPLEVEPGGKVFPVSRNSTDILRVLIQDCHDSGVEIKTNEPVREVFHQDSIFHVITGNDEYTAHHLLIATGGCTYPATGSTGDGYAFAKSFGHHIISPGPALTSVMVKNSPFSVLSGISFADLTINLIREGKKIRTHTGDLLFTHIGLSGPGILDFSRYIMPGDILQVSFLPGLKAHDIRNALIERIAASGTKQVKSLLTSFDLPDRFVRLLLEIAGIDQDLTAAHLSRTDRTTLIDLVTACPFPVSHLGGMHESMATRGGVNLSEIQSKTMESRLVSGLFFGGEVMDIDGDTGGYNLQAAFSTGYIAARTISMR